MFSELLLVFVTLIGVGFVGDYSIILGIILFSALTYLCTRNCLKESVGERGFRSKTETNFLCYYVNRYACKVGNVIRRIICSVRWSFMLLQTRRVLYIFKIVKGGVEIESQSANEDQQHYLLPTSGENCKTPKSVDVEIKTIVDCILREYIKSWYHNKISQNSQFISEVNYIIHDTISAFCNGVSNIERKKFLCHILQLYLHFFFHFKEALNKVGSEQNVLEMCISKKKEIAQNLKMHHWAMKDKLTEWFYLQSMMGSLIDSFGPVEFLSCPILHSVIVEILTRAVLYPLISTLTDPDRINSWILKLLQNILKNDSESLIHFVSGNSKTGSTEQFNSVIDLATSVPNFEKPVILLSKEDSLTEAPEINDGCRSGNMVNEYLNASSSSSKLFDISTEKLSDTSRDIFDGNMSDISQNSSQVLVDSNVQIDDAQEDLVFPCVNTKAISNENLSNALLNIHEVNATESSKFLEVARIKRSRSADYIRQMPHMIGLLPLNRSNNSIRLHGKNNKTFIQFKSDKRHSADIEMAEEAIEKELPPLFTDVRITETQQQEDQGHAPYTLYCIQYNGVFQDASNDEDIPTLVRQAVNIKRRFREFLALQSRLEDNPSLRRHLKGIKGPSKWQATPFTHLDKKNVAERKPFLEKYLQELCKRDDISKSAELQEFLAYGGDASIAFVKKSTDIGVPRIDKMLVRSVKGAFDLFRTALPTTSPEGIIPEAFIPCELEPTCDETFSESDFQVYLVDFSTKGPEIVEKIETHIANFDDDSSTGSTYDSCHASHVNYKHKLFHSLSINDHDSCTCVKTISSLASSREENQLANIIIDVVVECFNKLPSSKTTSHVQLFKFLFGSIFDRYVEEKLDGVTEEKCAHLLHSFHKAIWPEDKHGHKKGHQIPNLPTLLTKIITKEYEERMKTRWLGQLLSHILGSADIFSAVEIVIGSIQNESLNKCILFYALDALNQFLCSKDM